MNPHDLPPSSQNEPAKGPDFPLASRLQRLQAAMLDGVIAVLVSFGLFELFGAWSYLEQQQPLPASTAVGISVLSIVAFLLIHGYWLKYYGQTVGKKILGIAVVDLDNNIVPFGRLITLRYVPIWLAGYVPMIGVYLPLADVLTIFNRERRCIHDYLAGTKVIDVRGYPTA